MGTRVTDAVSLPGAHYMDGPLRRAHPFFALFTLSLLSWIAFVARRATSTPPPHARFYRRSLRLSERATESPLSSSSHPPPPSLFGAALAPPPQTSSSSSSTSSTSSTTPLTTSSIPTTTTSTSTTTSSSTITRPLSSPPTTTIPTSSSAFSTSASSSTSTYSLATDITPSTTLGLNDSPASTTTDSSVDPSSSESSSSNSTSSATQFWANKGAVAATFTFISLLAVAFSVMIVVITLKRRKAQRDAIIDAEFMPHYQEPKSRASSPTPSISSAPLDPFKSREIVHDNVPTEFPSIMPSAHLGRELPAIHLTPPSAFPGPSRYLLPSQLQVPSATSAAGQRNKAEMRVSTQSGYQPSFDSFYGAYSP